MAMMAAPASSNQVNLSTLETKDRNNLIHLLCKGKLNEAKSIKDNITTQQKEAVKELLKSQSHDTKTALLKKLLDYGCQPHELNNKGETPFAIQWKKYVETIPRKAHPHKLIEVDQEERVLLEALSRAGAGPSKAVIAEMASVTISIAKHNMAVPGTSVADPENILRWTPVQGILGEGQSCDVQAEILQHTMRYLDDDQTDPLVTIAVLKSIASQLPLRVAEYGGLVEFLLALHRLFTRRPKFHVDFLKRRLVQELLPIVVALMGDDQCGAINELDEDTSFSPLHIAAACGLDKVVKELLEHPTININITSRLVPNPLMHVLFHMKKTKMWQTELFGPYVEIAKMLADDDRLDGTLKDRNGATALSLCVKVVGDMGCRYREKHIYYSLHQHKTRELLIPLEEEQSITFLCVRDGLDRELTNLMQDHPDLDLEWADENEMTVLHIACKMSMYTTIKALIKKEPGLCNIPDKYGNTPLFYLVTHLSPKQTLEMVQQPLYADLWDFEHPNNMGERVREYYKTRAGNVYDSQIFKVIKMKTDTPPSATLKRERDLRRSQFTVKPKQAKKAASDENKLEIESFVEQLFTMEDVFHRLVEISGEMVNSLDNEKSPLIYCTELGLFKEAKYLLENSTDLDINLQGRKGCTALHLAALANQVECTKLLLRNQNIDVNIQDSEGNTALFYIVVKFLPEDAIPLVPTHPWGFAIENHTSQTAFSYYKKNTTVVDLRLLDQLRRRCVKDLSSEPVTPLRGNSDLSWASDMFIQPSTSTLVSAAPPLSYYESIPEEPGKAWQIVLENRTFFLENFVESDIFFQHLVGEKIMDSDFVNTRFRSTQKTDREMAEDLLQYLSKRGDSTLPAFLQALDLSNQEHVAKRLRKLTKDAMPEVETRSVSKQGGTKKKVKPSLSLQIGRANENFLRDNGAASGSTARDSSQSADASPNRFVKNQAAGIHRRFTAHPNLQTSYMPRKE